MELCVRTLWLPKAGNSHEEYEDAFSPCRDGSIDGRMLKLAVADGSSEGILSGTWAQILVRSFCRSSSLSQGGELPFVEKAYRWWARWKKKYISCRQKRNRPIQWYEEPWLEIGAFSTVLGLILVPDRWTAVAVGDTCLFQVRREGLLAVFPLEYSADFGNAPFLLCSNRSRNAKALHNARTMEGEWQVGDTFYLMTDALARWFLGDYEAEHAPWSVLRGFGTTDESESFEEWIGHLREQRHLRNDDVTFMRIDIVRGA